MVAVVGWAEEAKEAKAQGRLGWGPSRQPEQGAVTAAEEMAAEAVAMEVEP